MHDNYKKFLNQSEVDRRGIFNAAAQIRQVPPEYIEKDFWVCLTLDILFNSTELQSHKLLFKGGTALSKGYGLINRFSEDIDIVVFRDDLGFNSDSDPTNSKLDLGSNARKALFTKLLVACQTFMTGDLLDVVARATLALGCEVVPGVDDQDGQTVLIHYPSIFGSAGYVTPVVKIEGGARSGLDPHNSLSISPYIAEVVPSVDFAISGVRTIDPVRTFWEKVLILHGIHCGFRDEARMPSDSNRMSRHYYDVAMMSQSDVGVRAAENMELLDAVRNHNLIAFNQRWKKFDEAIVGRLLIYPQQEVAEVLARDYKAMSGMIMGDAPGFNYILAELRRLHEHINEFKDN
jgi:hypothetical protein